MHITNISSGGGRREENGTGGTARFSRVERPGSVPGTGGSLRKAAERPEFGPDRPYGSAQQSVGSS